MVIQSFKIQLLILHTSTNSNYALIANAITILSDIDKNPNISAGCKL